MERPIDKENMICRICFQNSKSCVLKSIFERMENDYDISSKLITITNISVS